MATQADVRRIALSLPEVEEAPNHFAFSVCKKGKRKGFVWVWMERVAPKKPRVPEPSVIAVRVASLDDKDVLPPWTRRSSSPSPTTTGSLLFWFAYPQ